jgi:hypothetical protein
VDSCVEGRCDGSGVVGQGDAEAACQCPAGRDLLQFEGALPLELAHVEDTDQATTERMAQLGAPAWTTHDLSDREEGPFERFDLAEIPPFNSPPERQEMLRAARIAAEEAEAA